MKNLILTTTIIILITPFLFSKPTSSQAKLEVNTQIVLQSGKVIAAGYIQSDDEQDLALECYLANGKTDESFAQAGRFVLPITQSNEQIFALKELPNGNIVLAAQSISFPKSSLIHIQLNSKGEVLSKRHSTDLGELVLPKKIANFGSGYLLAGLVKKDGQLQQFIQAFMSNGQLLKGFGTEGKLYISSNGQFKDINVQTNHHILLLGQKLIQISPKGQILQQHSPRFQANRISVNEQQILLGGADEGAFILQKFDHQIQALNHPQKYYLPHNAEANLKAILLKEDGQLILAGQLESSSYDHNTDWLLLALNPQLELNPNFGQAGFYQLDLSQEDDELENIYQENERLILVGFKNSFDDKKAVIKSISEIPQ